MGLGGEGLVGPMAPSKIPTRTVERLARYRRIVRERADKGVQSLYSHELAALAAGTAAQVRRDLMSIGCTGSSNYGYRVVELLESIGRAIDDFDIQRVALVGVGNLGAALLDFVVHCCPNIVISAAFDLDFTKTDRVYHGVHVYNDSRIAEIVREEKINVAIICVPASAAQEVVDQLVAADVTGILNFAPKILRTPINVYVEQIDMTVALEKVAYFTRLRGAARKER
jgi:redox-sensing transcriptional repressor